MTSRRVGNWRARHAGTFSVPVHLRATRQKRMFGRSYGRPQPAGGICQHHDMIDLQRPGAAPRVGVLFRPQLPPERLRSFVVQADASGLDDVWLCEDCFLHGGLTAATAALAWTRSIRVGLGLMPAPLRNPALASMEIATIARLFPGRFVPAVGHGVQDWMAQAGARAESPMTLLREWTAAVRAQLHGQRVSMTGRYVQLDGVALDRPPPRAPSLLIGARGPRTLALAGELADGVVLDSGLSPDQVRRSLAQMDRGVHQEVVVYLPTAIGDGALERLGTQLAAWGEREPEPVAAGSPDDAADVIYRYAQAGADTIVLSPADDERDIDGVIELAAAARERLQPRNSAHQRTSRQPDDH
jgi:alkanesulfonate monooxygenase SsuD/methylene tetrahydromethanopterin reductase-like flavin-dependent oxidoreductase (luciferase family)